MGAYRCPRVCEGFMRFHPLGPGQKGVAQRGGRSVSAAGGGGAGGHLSLPGGPFPRWALPWGGSGGGWGRVAMHPGHREGALGATTLAKIRIWAPGQHLRDACVHAWKYFAFPPHPPGPNSQTTDKSKAPSRSCILQGCILKY